MKLFTADKIRALDAYTIEHEPIPSLDLMERASNAFVHWFIEKFPVSQRPVFVFCGMGNNGGDGLAISRLLLERGYSVSSCTCRFTTKGSPDFMENEKRLRKLATPLDIEKEGQIPEIPTNAIIVDAIFGSGLSRPVKGIAASLIERINESAGTVVAVDIPSGLYADKPNGKTVLQILANHTVSFQMPKLAFMFPENTESIGEWHLVDIGLSPKGIQDYTTPYALSSREEVAKLLKKRLKFAHKGSFGHLLTVVGSKGKMGAAVLTVRAALKVGTGLLTAHVPNCGYSIMQTSVPEAMCLTDSHETHISEIPVFQKATAVALGPGIDQANGTRKALEQWLRRNEKPIVLDADGLNLLAQNPDWWQWIPAGSVLTPHPKEFERLFGKLENSYAHIEKMREVAQQRSIVLLLKGAHTAIALPNGDVQFNSTGNPGMATGGSGDVLTGIIGGLLAGAYSAKDATVLGVFIHGLAGDLAAEAIGQESLSASDIIAYLPQAFRQLYLERERQGLG